MIVVSVRSSRVIPATLAFTLEKSPAKFFKLTSPATTSSLAVTVPLEICV